MEGASDKFRSGGRVAAVMAVIIAALGAVIGLIAIIMTIVTGNVQWVILLLPALGLVKLGSMAYRVRLEASIGKRERAASRPDRPYGQDFAHHNKAWDNVSRWEERYGERVSGKEGPIGKPQRKLESWRIRLKR